MIINIASASGGQGRSTLASSLAAHLSAQYPGRVLLVDCCSDVGVQWLLGAERTTAYDLGDALCGRCCVGDAMYTVGGLRIMPPAADDSEVCPHELARLLIALSQSTDFVLLDCPCGSWSFVSAVADCADVTLLCSNADEFHLSAAYRLRRRLPEEDSRCRLVLTGYSLGGVKNGSLWGIDRAIDKVGARLIGVIPDHTDRRNDADAAYRNIAGRLLGQDIPLMKLR